MRCPDCCYEGSGRFCPHCGVRLQRICHRCGMGVDQDASFCPGCGERLSSADANTERKSRSAGVDDVGMVKGDLDQSTKIGRQTIIGGPAQSSGTGDVGMVKGNLDQSTNIERQTNIRGSVTINQGAPQPTAAELIRRGHGLLNVRAYSDAAKSLQDALVQSPSEPRASLLLGLALLGGRNPELASPSTIRKAESCLKTAARNVRLRPASVTVLCAIKYDHYVRNGMAEGEPTLEEIVADLRAVRLTESDRQLLKHLDATARAKQLLDIDW